MTDDISSCVEDAYKYLQKQGATFTKLTSHHHKYLFLEYVRREVFEEHHEDHLRMAVNRPIFPNGDSELMYVPQWSSPVEDLFPWFLFLVECGGDVYRVNRDGASALDILKTRFESDQLNMELYEEFVMMVWNMMQKRRKIKKNL